MGAREQFEGLYRAHAGAVRTFARRRSSASEADDVVAEVFLAVWRRLEDVPSDPLPWLLGLARGVLANSRRRYARSAALVARLMNEELAGVSSTPGEVDAGVLRALSSLSERDQELLLLVAWEGLSREQVGAVLGLARGTVAVRVHRARRRLARALAAEEETTRSAGGRSPELEVS